MRRIAISGSSSAGATVVVICITSRADAAWGRGWWSELPARRRGCG
jgi:hypothetical protein